MISLNCQHQSSTRHAKYAKTRSRLRKINRRWNHIPHKPGGIVKNVLALYIHRVCKSRQVLVQTESCLQ